MLIVNNLLHFVAILRINLRENNFWYPTVGWCNDCDLEAFDNTKKYKITDDGTYGELANTNFPTDFYFSVRYFVISYFIIIINKTFIKL